jgi:hypothetical protein
MKRLMLRHAFTDVQEVLFTVAERNLRSRRAVEKLGAERAGAEDAPRWGQIHVIYRLRPQLWEQRAEPGYGPAIPMKPARENQVPFFGLEKSRTIVAFAKVLVKTS